MTAKQDQLALIQSTIEKAQVLKNRNDASVLYSMLRQRQRKPLSSRQQSFLEVLVERNSDTAIQQKREAQSEWETEWAEQHELRAKAEVIAEYYLRAGYFRDIAMGIKDWTPDNNVILPPRHKIEKMLSNKYAEKVWTSHTAPPKWAVGDMVTLRKQLKGDVPKGFTGAGWNRYGTADKPLWHETSFMVLAVGHRPIDKALAYNEKSGGTRYYKLLPVGYAQPVEVLECDIKKLLKRQTQ